MYQIKFIEHHIYFSHYFLYFFYTTVANLRLQTCREIFIEFFFTQIPSHAVPYYHEIFFWIRRRFYMKMIPCVCVGVHYIWRDDTDILTVSTTDQITVMTPPIILMSWVTLYVTLLAKSHPPHDMIDRSQTETHHPRILPVTKYHRMVIAFYITRKTKTHVFRMLVDVNEHYREQRNNLCEIVA